jgi:hypothetical protein
MTDITQLLRFVIFQHKTTIFFGKWLFNAISVLLRFSFLKKVCESYKFRQTQSQL